MPVESSRRRVTLPLLAALAVAAAAPFDGYVPHAVIYRDLLVGDIAGLVLIGLVLARQRAEWRPAPGWAAVLCVGVLLVAVYAISLALHPSAGGLAKALRLTYLVALLWAIPLSVPESRLGLMIVLLALGTAFRYALEARAFFSSPSFVIAPYFQFGSFTSNPNTLSGFGSAALAATVGLTLSWKGWKRAVACALVAVFLAGNILSFSKGGWIASAVGVILCVAYGLPTFSRRSVNAGLAVAALGLVIAAATPARSLPGLMLQRWTSHGSALSNAERVRYGIAAVELVRDHPMLGVGVGAFGQAFRRSQSAVLAPDDPHDVYLAVATDAGVGALTCYLLLIAGVLFAAHLIATHTRAQVRLRAGLLGAVAAVAVFGLVSAEPISGRTAWVLAACALVGPSRSVEPDGRVDA